MVVVLITACQNQQIKDPGTQRVGNGHQKREGSRKRYLGEHADAEAVRLIYINDTVYVPEGSPVNNQLKIITIHPENIRIWFTTTGVVKPLSGHVAHVGTPFDGRVLKCFVKLGGKVSIGTPLFEVSSSDYLETVRICLQASQQKELAEKNFRRKQELLESGVISGKEYDEAKTELDMATKECEKTSATLRIFNLSPEEADLSKPLLLRSPIAGEVIFTNVTVGQYLRTDDEPVITVADLKKIWVVARVKEKDLGAINLNDRAEVITEGFPDKPVVGMVNYIGNIMDEQTRSVEVYLECFNDEKMLKPGMFITTRFYRQLHDAIVIPATAVLQDHRSSYVFMKAGKDRFIKKDILAETYGQNYIIVKSGLSEGDIIVTEGSIYLR
jgi:cobalt-zinc-cadmium efflux system membrane fusion protein